MTNNSTFLCTKMTMDNRRKIGYNSFVNLFITEFKMKTKIILFVLVLAAILSLSACGKKNETPQITAPVDGAHDAHDHDHNQGSNGDLDSVLYPKAPSYYDNLYEKGYNFVVYYASQRDYPFIIQLFLDGGNLVKTIETKNEPGVLEGITDSDAVFIAIMNNEEDELYSTVTFHDITNNKTSESYPDFLAASYDVAVFAGENGFIVRDFFDDSVYYKELDVDASEYNKSDIEYVYVQASPNGQNIVISYTYNGVDYDKPFKLK